MLQKNDTTLPYHAFGMEMPGRKWQASDYRYSHNGHEKEDAIFNGAQSAEFWMYDSRIGRRWERDPIVKPWESLYASFANNPILYADPDGLTTKDPKEKSSKANGSKMENGQKAKVTEPNGTKYGQNDDTRSLGKSSQTFNNDCKCYINDGLMENAEANPVTSSLDTKAANTYATSLRGWSNNLGFDVFSYSGSAGAIGTLELSYKSYRTGYNPLLLWSDKQMTTFEADAGNGIGLEIGADYGQGEFRKLGIWENPFERVINANDLDLNFQTPYLLRAGSNSGDGTYDYSNIGIGYGFKTSLKSLKADEFGRLIDKNPLSGGVGVQDPKVLYMSKPTIFDSIRTGLNNPDDSTGKEVLKRYNVKPKCLTCK